MVDREKVIKGLECCAHEDIGDCENCPYNENTPHCDIGMMRDALALLKEQEPRVMTLEEVNAVDAVPVVHARWINYPECLGYEGAYWEENIVCSACHSVWNVIDNDADRFDYCPACGAKMDGDT